MSPEQAEGHAVDARSDIFSFGAILYEMLSGLRAFRAGSTFATLAAVINLEPEPLAKVARARAAARSTSWSAPASARTSAGAPRARPTSRSSSTGCARRRAPDRCGPRRRSGWAGGDDPPAIGGIVVAAAVAARGAVAGGAAADGVHAVAADRAARLRELSDASRRTAARSRSPGSARAAPAPTSTRRRSAPARRCG